MSKLNGTVSDSSLEAAIVEALAGYDLQAERAAGRVDVGADFVVDIPTGRDQRRLTVDIRRSLPRGALRRSADIVGHVHVPPILADRYRDEGQFFVDTVGNAFINLPGFIVDVRGRPAPADDAPVASRGKAFTRTGAQVLFALLVRPTLAASPVRTLAHLSRASVGTTSMALDDLRRAGHVSSDGARLINLPTLAELWLATYRTRLAPKLAVEELGGPSPMSWVERPIPGAALTGGVALARGGDELSPAVAQVYGTPPWTELRTAARLQRDAPITVELREQFWHPDLTDNSRVAPALVVYADAAASGDSRVRTAAARMWENDDDLQPFHPRG